MNLYALDRKKLWGLAAAKCSICKSELFLKEESDTNVGNECHISSHRPNHPSKSFSRHDPNLTDVERDKKYDNAILLCANCHEVIDNPESTKYTIEKLHQIKAEHEAWVSKKLEEDTDESRELKKTIEEVNLKFDEFFRVKGEEIELLKHQIAQKEHEIGTKRLKEAFSDVKIFESNGEDTCEYPPNPSWLKIHEVRKYLENHEALELWEKIELAGKHYKEVEKEVRGELVTIVDRDVLAKVSFDIEPYSGEPNVPSNWYWRELWDEEHRHYELINAIINKSPPLGHQQDGAFFLNSATTGNIAKTDKKTKREEIEVLIIAVMGDEETKRLVREVKEAKDAIGKAERLFKKKLTKIVRNLRFNAGGL